MSVKERVKLIKESAIELFEIFCLEGKILGQKILTKSLDIFGFVMYYLTILNKRFRITGALKLIARITLPSMLVMLGINLMFGIHLNLLSLGFIISGLCFLFMQIINIFFIRVKPAPKEEDTIEL